MIPLVLTFFAVATLNCATSLAEEEVGEALFLTPLIKTRQFSLAKEKSLVHHEVLGSIESYAGYFTVDEKYNSSLFFWYFPAETNPKDAPVALWLEGGPGASSIFSLFAINGPFAVLENKTIVRREYSWHKTHNIIYIDNPVGTGYSFTDDDAGLARNQGDLARNLLSAVVQFFDLFSELRSNDFYVIGESYAGKYVASVARAIKQHNGKVKNNKINLQGLAIGNAYTDPINQVDFSEMLYRNGLLDFNGRDEVKALEEKLKALIRRKKYLEGYDALVAVFDKMRSLAGIADLSNYVEVQSSGRFNWYYQRVQEPDVRKALHVGNITHDGAVKKVVDYLKEDNVQSVANVYADLLKNYRVLFYSGQLDLTVAYVHTEKFLLNLNWQGAAEYKKAPRKQWKVGDDLAGYYKTVKNLTEVLIRNAGHVAPADQPKWAFDMITRFTHKKPF